MNHIKKKEKRFVVVNVVTCCNGSCTRQGDVIVSDVRQALLQMLLKVVNRTLLLYRCMSVKVVNRALLLYC